MEELKQIFSKNITELRKKSNITQAELAEKLNYSDKAISKWERGDSIPDVAMCKQIADLFGVTVDYLLQSDHTEYNKKHKIYSKRKKKNRVLISILSTIVPWFIATFVFANTQIFGIREFTWLAFVYAVPVSFIILLVFNSLWGRRRINFLIVSLLVWTLLASVYLSFLTYNIWQIYLIGIPAQIAIIVGSNINKR